MFYALLVLLAVIPLALLAPALLNRRRYLPEQQAALNIRVAADRLAELAADAQANTPADEREIHAALLDDLHYRETTDHRVIRPLWSLPILVFIPLFALAVYAYLGTPALVTEPPGAAVAGSGEAPDLDALLARLERRLVREPDNAKAWGIAAETYLSLGDYRRANRAYQKLNELVPGNPLFMTGWADAMIMDAGNVYTPAARRLIERALAVDPDNINALWIAGLGLSSLGAYQEANEALAHLLPLLAEDGESRTTVRAIMEKNRQALAGTETAAATGRRIPLTVSMDIDPAEIGGNNPVIFIIARSPTGPAAPLAVARVAVAQLPIQIVLDDGMAMLPGHNLSSADQVELVARLSRAGVPTAQPGDYTSAVKLLDTAALDAAVAVELVIGRQVAP